MRRLIIVALLVALSAGDALARDYEHHVNLKGGATLQVAGTTAIDASRNLSAGTGTFSGDVASSGGTGSFKGGVYVTGGSGQTAYKTSTGPVAFSSNSATGTVVPFTDSQNLIIQAYTDGTNARDVVIATGATAALVLRASRNGEVSIGVPASPGVGAGKLNVASDARIEAALTTAGRIRAVRVCAAACTTVAADEVIVADATDDMTVTLITAAAGRAQWIFKGQSTGTVTIAAGSGDTINGGATKTLTVQYSGAALTARNADIWYGTALTAL